MLINLRNALMAGKRLPYDAEVEYLESTGTQWIDTGVVVADPSTVSVSVTRVSGDFTFGFTHGNMGTGTWLGVKSSVSKAFFKNYDTTVNMPNTWQQLRWDGSSGLYTDGSLVGAKSASVGTDAIGSTSWPIFAMHEFYNGRVSQKSSGQISSVQIEVFGTLVRDFIPVRVGTVGYLYDRVSGRLFGNAGSGDFVLGPDVVPVEYIESHGTEWIDTGVTASTSVSPIKIHFSPTATEQWLVGGGDSSSAGLGLRTRGYNSSIISVGYGWTNPLTYWNRELRPINIIGLINKRLYFNDYSANTLHFTGTYNVNFALFGRNIAGSVEPAKAIIYSAEIGVRDYIPVRVGTEGAMMDTLTRRIYRNAGTGAFTYGNDLKYPIPAA